MWEITVEIAPPRFAFEAAVPCRGTRADHERNVPPLLKSAEFAEMQRLSEQLGYKIEGRVLSAADYGAPQTRRRAIVIGSRIGPPSFPSPTHADPLKRNVLTAHLPAWRTVRDAIGHLALTPTGQNWHIGRNPTAKSLQRYRSIPPGGNRWDLPRSLMPECWKRKTKGGTDLFGRLWWDRPSVTIRTEFYKPEKGRYQRRIRELRDEDGLQILSHNDRDALKPGEYLLESLTPRPVIARDISDKLRRQILERNGYTCQVCGAGAGEESGCEVGKKCRLQIDHTVPISQGGTDEEHNLRAVCTGYNRDKANLKVPTSRDAISVMALIRRQPRDVQREVYEFLSKKFGQSATAE